MRRIAVVAAIALLASAAFGLALAHSVPETPQDALRHCGSLSDDVSSEFEWKCPTDGGSRTCVLTMEIPEKEFESSMHENILRTGSVFAQAPFTFVRPDDPYVRTIADHILSETEGLSDLKKATAALWFVQSTIDYAYDSDLYGMGNYWAFPLETLYLRKGDCEDTSVLLCSILEAMGFDTVLLDYPNHMATGVKVDGLTRRAYTLDDGTYGFCETTLSVTCQIGEGFPDEDPDHIWHPSGGSRVKNALNTFVSGYRYLFQRITTI